MKQGPQDKKVVTQCIHKMKRQKMGDSLVAVEQSSDDAVQQVLSMPELVANILHYYPHYAIRGQTNPMAVSKQWYEIISKSDFYDTTSFENLIKECLKEPEGVIQILRDQTLLNKLTMQMLLEIIACHKELAIHLLQNKVINFKTKNEIHILAKHHPEVAMFLAENAINYFKDIEDSLRVDGENITRLGCQHPQVAQYILNTQSLFLNLNECDLQKLSMSDPNIASQMMHNPEIYAKLDYDPGPSAIFKYLELMIALCKKQESFSFLQSEYAEINTPADFVNHLEVLCSTGMPMSVLRLLGYYHCEIAIKILKTPFLVEKLNLDEIVQLGEAHAEVAMMLLNDEALCNQLHRLGLTRLAVHKNVARYIVNTPILFSKLKAADILHIGVSNPEMAIDVLKLDGICIRLDEVSVCMIAQTLTAINYILKTPAIYEKITSYTIISVAKKFPFLIEKILNTPALCEKLSEQQQTDLKGSYPLAEVLEVSKVARSWNIMSNKVDDMNTTTIRSTAKR